MDARSLSGVFTYTYPRTDADVRNRELWESSQPLQPILITTTLTLLGLLPVSPPRPHPIPPRIAVPLAYALGVPPSSHGQAYSCMVL